MTRDEKITKLISIRAMAHGAGAAVGCHVSDPATYNLNLHAIKQFFREITKTTQDLLEAEGFSG